MCLLCEMSTCISCEVTSATKSAEPCPSLQKAAWLGRLTRRAMAEQNAGKLLAAGMATATAGA